MQFKLSEGNDNFSVDIILIDVKSGFASISYKSSKRLTVF